jgi:hypothetical protein
MGTSKIGVLFLAIAIIVIALVNFQILLALGFLYYAYKLLRKGEKLKRIDKGIVIILFALIFLEAFSSIFFSNNMIGVSQSSVVSCTPDWTPIHQGMSAFGSSSDVYCKNFCSKYTNGYEIENDTCYCDANNCSP